LRAIVAGEPVKVSLLEATNRCEPSSSVQETKIRHTSARQ